MIRVSLILFLRFVRYGEVLNEGTRSDVFQIRSIDDAVNRVTSDGSTED